MQQNSTGGPEIWLRGPVNPAAAPARGGLPTMAAPAPPGHSTTTPQFGQHGPAPRAFSWMNAHGGAGTSTLATVFAGHDAGSSWPDPAAGDPPNVLLVARTNAAGLAAVSRVLDMIRRDDLPSGINVSAVVFVADAPGRLPRELAQRIKVISSVIDIHRVPWVPAWRTGDLTGPPPREVSALGLLTGKK
ncbi:DUF6668 family protein [Streptomyces sp. NPDC003038]|uniref:DUF6668 family protein n=1 Tax=unclassified Streptomyces TaxID=2593676 RepID=UPI0033B4F48E